MNTLVAYTYAVTALTRDGTRVWCDLLDGWLVMFYTPTYLDHGPHIKDVYYAASLDLHLSDVLIREVEATRP